MATPLSTDTGSLHCGVDPQLGTLFAPAARATSEEIAAQHEALLADPVVTTLLDSFPEPALILNRQRQIVLANDKMAAFLGCEREALLGLRPGEALDCLHKADAPAGCGTTQFCRNCGAANAIVNSQRTLAADVQECRISSGFASGGSAMDLRVWATPLTVGGIGFTVFAVRDTTDEKRRQVLERLFFHDVLNSAGTLRSIMEIWPALSAAKVVEMTQIARRLSCEVVEQIQAQRDLAAAERGELKVNWETVDADAMLSELCMMYSHHRVADRKQIAAPTLCGSPRLRSDSVLLRRVLGNLIKNALEASAPGQTVTVSFENHAAPIFRIHNESAMPENVRTQIFQRSFSTKDGTGRGLGTYSVKLLTGTYLKGRVEFRSTPEAGTTFVVELPQ